MTTSIELQIYRLDITSNLLPITSGEITDLNYQIVREIQETYYRIGAQYES